MAQNLNEQEKATFSKILFKESEKNLSTLEKLSQQQKKKLQPLLAQKIAYASLRTTNESKVGVDNTQYCACLKTTCCCCMPSTYQDYFDITSAAFYQRLKGVLMFWRNDFLTIGDKKFETYGPFWICVTYSIILTLIANVADYFSAANHDSITFDTNVIGYSFATCIIFVFLIPLIIYGIARGMSPPSSAPAEVVKSPEVKPSEIKPSEVKPQEKQTNKQQVQNVQPLTYLASICIYGYSLLWFIPSTILCMIPSDYWQLGFLAGAGLINGIFLARNYYSYTKRNLQGKTWILLIVILLMECVFIFTIYKVFFSNGVGGSLQDGTKNMHFLHRKHLINHN